MGENMSHFIVSTVPADDLGPILLSWINLNPSMDK